MSKYYAVAYGREIGIFRSWGETEPLVKGFKGAKYKSFKNEKDARDFITQGSQLSQQPSRELVEAKHLPVEGPILQQELIRKPVEGQIPKHSIGLIEILAFKRVYYTDGSCVNKVGGYGFVEILIGGYKQEKGRVPHFPTTNQVSELYAINEAILHAKKSENSVYPVLIYTDSKYSIGCLTQWCHNWKKNGWINSKGNPVENQDIIKSILQKMESMKVEFKHVKAHNGNKYNEMADELANQGRSM